MHSMTEYDQGILFGFCQSNSFLISSMRKFCPVNNKSWSVLKFSIFPQQSFYSTLTVYYNKASFNYNLRELSGQWRQFRGLGAKTGRRLRKRKKLEKLHRCFCYYFGIPANDAFHDRVWSRYTVQSLIRSLLIGSRLDLGSCEVITWCFFINMLLISEVPSAAVPTQAKDNYCSY